MIARKKDGFLLVVLDCCPEREFSGVTLATEAGGVEFKLDLGKNFGNKVVDVGIHYSMTRDHSMTRDRKMTELAKRARDLEATLRKLHHFPL